MNVSLIKFILPVFFLLIGLKSNCQQKGQTVKVITYNIWNGYDFGNDEDRRAKLVDWVKSQNTDIVGLQELCRYTPGKLKEDAQNWGHKYSVLLKKSGYSVGLTSKYPIEVIEKIFDGMHHGALHCKTAGIDVFVIHFSPHSYKRRREETKLILEKLREVAESNPRYLVMGDFNAFSPFDADLYKNEVLLQRMRKSNADKGNSGNLVDNEFDYAVLSGFLSFPLIDVCQKYTVGMAERGSFPGRVLGTVNKESNEELVERLERIDYLMVSPELGKKCIHAKVHNEEDTWYLSDHYPVEALFEMEMP